jgi:dienelactone hydrolase
MKYLQALLFFSLIAGCGHMKKEKSKDSYTPEVSFEQESKTYSAKVQVPKDMKDKVPLVVIVHEWWGRTDYIQMRSEMLNMKGFATLPVDLYGNGKIAMDAKEAGELATPFYKNPQMGVDLLNKYIAEAKKDPHVDPSKVYVIGYCFGGTQALNLARSGADIAGVASFHGGLEAGIKSTGIKAKILAANGLADPMVPPKQRKAFEKEMKDLKVDYRIVNYRNATHAFTNPKATELGKKFNIPVGYNKHADEASWKELMKFLGKK